MPTHRAIEVWIEDSEHRKLTDQECTINLVDADDRTVSVKTEMLTDERYTVHCRSPVSVVCDVFVTTASGQRKSAARFYLNKNLAISEYVTGSSADHTLEQFRHGLRTPKRTFKQGRLGTVELEVRRIGQIIKGEPREDYPDDESDEGVEFIMVDQPNQPPWIVFRFDINVKSTVITKFKRPPRVMRRDRSLTGSGNETSCEFGHDDGYHLKKRRRVYGSCEESSSYGVGRHPSLMDTESMQLLQQEYEREEAEEKRLVQKLQERVQAKRTRNMELRRLLGETS